MTEPNTEVTQGSKERLEVLELDRTPRDEKLARETAMLEGASEVHYAERAFRPRHPATLDDVRTHVDALEPKRLPLPEPAPLPPAHDAPARAIPDHLRRPLEAAQPDATLVSVEVAYTTGTGHVVEALFDLDGVRRTEQYLIEGEVARAVDDVDAAVDSLPAPRGAPAPAPEASASPRAAEPTTPDAPKEKGSRFKLPFGKGKGKPAEPAPPDETSADDKPAKSRFSFRRAREKE